MREKKENTLAIKNPTLAKSWHPTKNGDITPWDVTCGVALKAWWVCPKGHEWQALIYNRHNGAGCPECAGYVSAKGKSILESHPEIAAEWHPTKNKGISIENITKGCTYRVWWQCKEGHEWEAIVNNRVYGRNSCPTCHLNANSFEAKHPELAKEWHPFLNGDLKPNDVYSSNKKEVWWLCRKGHIWHTSPNYRHLGKTCPDCGGGSKRGSFYRNLEIEYPKIASWWDYDKNFEYRPCDVLSASNKLAFWKCERGHEWEEAIHSLVHRGTCLYCEGKKASHDNNITISHPEIAAEWHPTKNGDLKATDLLPHKRIRVWWKCNEGHEFQRTVANRTSKKKPCPFCEGKEASRDNNITISHPEIAAEWHPTKNGDLKATYMLPHKRVRVWWKCSEGHEFQRTVANRTSKKKSCPKCARIARIKEKKEQKLREGGRV